LTGLSGTHKHPADSPARAMEDEYDDFVLVTEVDAGFSDRDAASVTTTESRSLHGDDDEACALLAEQSLHIALSRELNGEGFFQQCQEEHHLCSDSNFPGIQLTSQPPLASISDGGMHRAEDCTVKLQTLHHCQAQSVPSEQFCEQNSPMNKFVSSKDVPSRMSEDFYVKQSPAMPFLAASSHGAAQQSWLLLQQTSAVWFLTFAKRLATMCSAQKSFPTSPRPQQVLPSAVKVS